MRRFPFILLFVLSSCRLEPGAMLGAGEEPEFSCSDMVLESVPGVPLNADQLGFLMSMFVAPGEGLRVRFQKTDALGVPKLKYLRFFRPRADSPPDELQRKAICSETDVNSFESNYLCAIENKGNVYDDEVFFVQYLTVEVGGVQEAFYVGPRELPCREDGQRIKVMLGNYFEMPSVIPSELKPKAEEE